MMSILRGNRSVPERRLGALLVAAGLAGLGGCSLLYEFDRYAGDAGDEGSDGADVEAEGGATCGNGRLETGESCDTAEPEACTSDCGSAGTRTCLACTAWSACTPPAEACNAEDDDCDTLTDEGFDCVRGASVECTTFCDTAGTGACTDACRVPAPEACTPPAESCDAEDDDCDTLTDEGFDCVRGTSVECTTTCGTLGAGACTDACTAPEGAACTPPAEWCDGLDDDCDTVADDGCACADGWNVEHPLAPGIDTMINMDCGAGRCFAVGAGGMILRYEHAAGRWTRVTPTPTTVNVKDVSVTGAGEAVAVGSAGHSVVFDGSTWHFEDTGTTDNLNAVSAPSLEAVFAGGNMGRVVFRDGSGWRTLETHTARHIYGIYAFSAVDAWAVGTNGTILHWDGTDWTAAGPPGSTTEMERVWGRAPDDVWVVGAAGTILHWNGTTWTLMPTGTSETLYGIWGDAVDDMWAVGGWVDGGVVLHYDGSVWTEADVPALDPVGFLAVSGLAADEAFILSRNGGLLGRAGGEWVPVSGGVTVSLRDIWGTSGRDVFAVGTVPHDVPEEAQDNGAAVLHYDGAEWTLQRWTPGGSARGVAGTGPDAAYLVGLEATLDRYDGTGWSRMSAGVSNADLHGIWGMTGEAFAVGGERAAEGVPVALRLRSGVWSRLGTPGLPDVDLLDVSGASLTSVVAVGLGGAAARFNPATVSFEEMTSGVTADLHGIHVVAEDDAWAVGAAGTILRWNGSDWTLVDTGLGVVADLHGVWAAAPDRVFVVGQWATLLQWDGSAWTQVLVEAMTDFQNVWGSSRDNVFLVGDQRTGSIAHRCGSGW